jgi:uncharacterized protein YdaU (DUF1376 family)
MPLHIADYLRDTNHLTATEHGAYLLLIMRYWQDGGLPDDERLIQRYSTLSPAQWEESRDVLSALFENGWRHKRIDAEIAKAEEIIDKRREAAKQRHSKPNANAEQDDCESTYAGVPPSQSPTSTSSLRSDVEPAKPVKRKSAIRETWEPDERDRSYAKSRGMTDSEIAADAEKFRDHHLKKGSVFKDWNAAWRTWCQNRGQYGPRQPNGTGPPKRETFASIAMQKIRERQQQDRGNEQLGEDVLDLRATRVG